MVTLMKGLENMYNVCMFTVTSDDLCALIL